jgi:O-antigen/teichoic acid export membrane protein
MQYSNNRINSTVFLILKSKSIQMLSSLKHLIKGDFFKNIVTLLTGNTIGQIIGFAAIPVLTRLYTPEEFGAVALFVSIANVLAIASNGRYDMAIVPPKRNSQAFHLLIGGIGLALIFSVALFIPIAIFNEKISSAFDDLSFNKIIWLLPLLVFIVGSHKSLHFWFNRQRGYKVIATNRVAQSASQTVVKLGRSFFSTGSWGLAIGALVGEVTSWLHFMHRLIKDDLWRFRKASFKSIKKAFNDYSNFPKFLMPMGVINAFSVNVLIFMLTAIANTTIVGYYERAWRVISMPFSLLSTSFGNVFYERMTRSENPVRLYLISYFANLAFAMVVLLPVLLWGEQIFSFVLGRDWAIAGKVAKLIVPLTVFNYATACVSNVFSVFQRNQVLLVWQVVYLMVVMGWILFAKGMNIYLLIQIYAFIGAALYAALALIGIRLVKSIGRDLPQEKKLSL